MGYEEQETDLSMEAKAYHKLFQSAIEELEAMDWYNQRLDTCGDKEIGKVLAYNKADEAEHFAMLLEIMRKREPALDKELKKHLFGGEDD